MIFNEFKPRNHIIIANHYDTYLEDAKGIYTRDLFYMITALPSKDSTALQASISLST